MDTVKEPATFDEQLDKLFQRGCIIGDENYAKRTLKRINYYRLTAYFLPFKRTVEGEEKYVSGTTFNKVHRIYEFDRKLRALLFSVVEEIEIMLRTQLSYYHAHKYGALGYLDENNFSARHNHASFIEHIDTSIKNNSTQAFVKHHIDNKDGKFPLWVVIELFTVGELSFFYSDMIVQDQKKIAKSLFNSTYKNVSKWLRCLTDLRNYCAHYSRLYYNLFPAIPPTPKNFSHTLHKRIFDYILVLKFLYYDPVNWKDVIAVHLSALLEEYSDCISLDHIGFPENWEDLI